MTHSFVIIIRKSRSDSTSNIYGFSSILVCLHKSEHPLILNSGRKLIAFLIRQLCVYWVYKTSALPVHETGLNVQQTGSFVTSVKKDKISNAYQLHRAMLDVFNSYSQSLCLLSRLYQ